MADSVNKELLQDIVNYAGKLAGIKNNDLPAGIDASCRGDLLFLTNFNGHSVTFPSAWSQGENVMGEALKDGVITLEAYKNAVIRIKK